MKSPVVFCPLVATDKLFAITTNANGFRHFDDPGLLPASFISYQAPVREPFYSSRLQSENTIPYQWLLHLLTPLH
jgi:hypothetical protein